MAAAGQDLSSGATPMDLSAHLDSMVVPPFNMPGKVFCYTGPTCSTTSANPICCDAAGADGGFSDNCVASAAACLAMDSKAKTFQCGQAADCTSGICCGATGMAKSGKSFIDSTSCAASCPSGQTQLCVTASECKTAGAHCVGQSISGREIGLCQ